MASVVQGPIVNPANGHSYSVLSPDTWLNNEAQATTLGGHLVTVNNVEENEWLASNFSNYGPLFIGITDQKTEGVFVWISGEKDLYRNWGFGEPNDNLGAEDFGLLYPNFSGQWNDGRTDHVANGIVEVVPEPEQYAATFGVTLLGIGVWLRRKKV